VAIDWTRLYPLFARQLGHLVGLLGQHGLKMRGTEGYRSPERQADLYAKGRTAPGNIVTNAKPGTSAHQWGCAVDMVFLTEGGKPTYEGDWDRFGALVEQVGLVWGGHFKSIKDRPHLEYKDWRRVKAAGWRPPKET